SVTNTAADTGALALFANAAAAEGTAVFGQASGAEGRGVFGLASAASGAAYAVYGQVDSPAGYSGFFTGGLGVRVDGGLEVHGEVGLNTAAPDRELTVFDSDADGDAALNLRATDGQEREMLLAVNQSSGGIISMQTNNDLFFRTNGTNRMVIASGGKVGIGRATAVHPLHVGTDATNGNGAHVTIGGTWVNGSSRLFKEAFSAVDPEAVLAGVAGLEISRWRYRGAEGEGAHLGPVAEAFHAAFGLGSDARYIATVDADGVALAAIQGLLQRNETLETRVADLEDRVAALEAAVEALLSASERRAP
ncbi:MAG: hypothetical protein R3181_04970, partial [Rubricoccaceae bacterium]|nr:hypothetical protein [Rubricoccaceae bacterium]